MKELMFSPRPKNPSPMKDSDSTKGIRLMLAAATSDDRIMYLAVTGISK